MVTPERCPSQDDKVLLFGLLSDTCARLERRVDNDLKAQCDLPLAWFETLLALRRSPAGRLTMSEIADETTHSTGGATRLVDRLVAAALVERVGAEVVGLTFLLELAFLGGRSKLAGRTAHSVLIYP